MNEHKIEEARRLLREVDKQRRQLDSLYHQVHRSLAICSLWPRAFDLGPVKSHWTSVPGDPRTLVFVVTRPDGSEQKWDLALVPDVLREDAPADYQRAFARLDARRSRTKEFNV